MGSVGDTVSVFERQDECLGPLRVACHSVVENALDVVVCQGAFVLML